MALDPHTTENASSKEISQEIAGKEPSTDETHHTPESMAIRGPQGKSQIQAPTTQASTSAEQEKLEGKISKEIDGNDSKEDNQETPVSVPFEWDDFESRYLKAMEEADEQDADIKRKLEDLSAYFLLWSEAPSISDKERSHKRLKTREFYVRNAETTYEAKKQHYEGVIQAFKNAMNLLNDV